MSVMHPRPHRRSWRWLLILALSVFTHLLAIGWASGHLGLPMNESAPESPPVSVALLAPPPPAPPPKAAPAATQPKPKPRPRPKPQPPAPAAPAAAATAATSAADATPAQEPATSDPGRTGSSPPESAMPAAPAEEEAAAASPWPADPPPSAALEYAVTALRDGQNWHGTGRFEWQAEDGRYRIDGEASITVLFRITVLNFRSTGIINPSGIAPEFYTEKPWRRETAVTTFDRQGGRIGFSASAASHPLDEAAQDRASISWQLAALGRGDPNRFASGGELDIVVAGARNADRWRIRVLGIEQVETPHGSYSAWHLQREPRGRRDQGIDIWLAPQLEWYPVRVRHNYANGEFLDMSLTELTPGAPRPNP